MSATTIKLTPELGRRLRRATGKKTTAAAVRAALDRVADEAAELTDLPQQVRTSERELRAGKGRRFSDAGEALKWLES
jgi:hypothetical protein